jgi:hypothetical protein
LASVLDAGTNQICNGGFPIGTRDSKIGQVRSRLAPACLCEKGCGLRRILDDYHLLTVSAPILAALSRLADNVFSTRGKSLVNKIVAVRDSTFDGYKYITSFDPTRIGTQAKGLV